MDNFYNQWHIFWHQDHIVHIRFKQWPDFRISLEQANVNSTTKTNRHSLPNATVAPNILPSLQCPSWETTTCWTPTMMATPLCTPAKASSVWATSSRLGSSLGRPPSNRAKSIPPLQPSRASESTWISSWQRHRRTASFPEVLVGWSPSRKDVWGAMLVYPHVEVLSFTT